MLIQDMGNRTLGNLGTEVMLADAVKDGHHLPARLRQQLCTGQIGIIASQRGHQVNAGIVRQLTAKIGFSSLYRLSSGLSTCYSLKRQKGSTGSW